MLISNKLKALGLAAGMLMGMSAQAAVIEDFEIGNCDAPVGAYPPAWTKVTEGGDFIDGGGAHDGACGATGDAGWFYRTDVSTGENSILSAWFRTGEELTGRFYLGFGADATGASSFVAAPNNGDIRFQNNIGYGFEELNTSAQQFEVSKWYRLEVLFFPGENLIGNLYDSDGTTLLNSLIAGGTTRYTGGVAVRSFDGIAYDTIELVSGQGEVPAPATIFLFGIALSSLGLVTRKRK